MSRRTTFGSLVVAAALWWPGGAYADALALTVEVPTEPSPTAGIACGYVGGPRRITRLRAFSVRCRVARRVARRWGRATDRDDIGDYSCRKQKRKVMCTASEARKVTFRVR